MQKLSFLIRSFSISATAGVADKLALDLYIIYGDEILGKQFQYYYNSAENRFLSFPEFLKRLLLDAGVCCFNGY